ncbi:MAG TPA: ATP-binding protein, partial [Polyangiales bacterium]|nr:ATP-binding protein [Polyangiales bacterium]
FNNLLTVIMSGTALAEVRVTDATARNELKAVMAAATRARDLTRQLLAMSRAQALSLRPLDLNGRLSELSELLRRVFPANVEISLLAGVQLPAVRADPSQLDQVFMNLCINARDAMPEGGQLTLTTELVSIESEFEASHPWAKPGRYVLTTVTDTGSGMEPVLLERVFEPFFTTKAPHSGTGLGLAVAYGIVRQHGGILQCSSELAKGTTFKVYLPAFERPVAVSIGDAQANPARSGNERILIAEDDPVLRALLERILHGAGYRVLAVPDGASALAHLQGQEYQLLLLDVVMPGMQCRDVVERARVLRPQLPILLSSGYSAGENILDLLSGSGLTLLRKPYDPDSLLQVVRDALDRAPSPLEGGM